MEKRLRAGAAIGTWALLFFSSLIAYLPALRGGLLWDKVYEGVEVRYFGRIPLHARRDRPQPGNRLHLPV